MAIEHALQRLLGRLREEGAGATPADLVDAARAARLVGIVDRELLRLAIRLVLARSPSEREAFDRAYDLEFGSGGRREASRGPRPGSRPGRGDGVGLGGRGGAGGGPPPPRGAQRGSSPVRHGAPPTARTRREGGRAVSPDRERRRRDPDAHPGERGRGRPGGEPKPGPPPPPLERRPTSVHDGEPVRDPRDPTMGVCASPAHGLPHTEHRRGSRRGQRELTPDPPVTSSPAVTRWAAPRELPHASPEGPLGSLDLSGELDPGAEAAAARELFRLLSTAPWARRRRPERSPRRGAIDVQRALRRGLASRGVPVVLPRRRPGVRPPRLVFLVDASWSCARASALVLAALGRLAMLARTVEIALFIDVPVAATREVRAWAAGRYAPAPTPRRPIPGTHVRPVPERAGFDAVLAQFVQLDPRRASDYGRALEGFHRRFARWLTPSRSTVLVIVGDARSNQFAACAWIAQELRAAVRRVAWLVTEPAERWGTGDSRLLDYARHADLLHEATTLDGLVAGLWAVLRLSRRSRQGS